jgi:hypothetical protein
VPLWALIPEMPLLLRSFWAAYGWGHVTWPGWVYGLLWAVHLVLLGPALGYVVRRLVHMARRPLGLGKTRAVAVVPTVATLALAWSGAFIAALLRWMQQVEAPHGRLLFPALGAWALLLTLGARQIRRAQARAGRWAVVATLGLSASWQPSPHPAGVIRRPWRTPALSPRR